MEDMGNLLAKEAIFVKEYAIDQNATRAAIKAGYAAKSKSAKKRAKIASVAGARMLEKPRVRAAIAAAAEKTLKKAGLSAQMVLDEIRKLAFVKLSDAYAEDGSLLHPKEMPEDVQASLNAVETDELFAGRGKKKRLVGVTKKVKLADKVRSLEMLARHFKLLTDVQETTGKDGGPIVTLTMPANGSEAAPVAPVAPEKTGDV
jgi:phage terminase small subunit